MSDLVFSNLVNIESDQTTPLPNLAKSWTASNDALTYSFVLDERANGTTAIRSPAST